MILHIHATMIGVMLSHARVDLCSRKKIRFQPAPVTLTKNRRQPAPVRYTHPPKSLSGKGPPTYTVFRTPEEQNLKTPPGIKKGTPADPTPL